MKTPSEGLNAQQWAAWRRNMLITGSYDPNDWHTLSGYQKDWTRDTLNTLRDLSKSENCAYNLEQ